LVALILGCVLGIGSANVSVRVDGPGYLRLVSNGLIVYAKSARLMAKGGWLADEAGGVFFPRIAVQDGSPTKVQPDGWVVQSDRRVGRLTLAVFPSGREPSGKPYLASGERPTIAFPGEGGVGRLVVDGAGEDRPSGTTARPSAPPVATSGISISIRTRSEVSADRFRLEDVADVSGVGAERVRELELGRSPVAGATAVLTRAQVLAALKGAGVNPDGCRIEMPARAEVVRTAQTVTHEQFVQAAVEHASRAVGGNAAFTCPDRPADCRVPSGRLELRVERFAPNVEGGSATVGVYVDGVRQAGRTLRLVATAADGGPLARVAAGAPVRLRVWSGGACVELPARLQESARVGQSVRVVTESRTVHTGVLLDANTVEVRL